MSKCPHCTAKRGPCMHDPHRGYLSNYFVTITGDDHEVLSETVVEAEDAETAETNALASFIDSLSARAELDNNDDPAYHRELR